ncbi:MAG: hypothetical protein H8E69_05175 [Actinobacteria bacterium]|nr:hypothetical protein [Actinomycetota bacterium]
MAVHLLAAIAAHLDLGSREEPDFLPVLFESLCVGFDCGSGRSAIALPGYLL